MLTKSLKMETLALFLNLLSKKIIKLTKSKSLIHVAGAHTVCGLTIAGNQEGMLCVIHALIHKFPFNP